LRRTRARRERINAGIVSEMLTGCGYGRQQSFTPLSVERVCRKQQRECSKTLYERRVQTATERRNNPPGLAITGTRARGEKRDTSAEIYRCSHNSDGYGTCDLEAEVTSFRPRGLSPHLSRESDMLDSKRKSHGKKRRDSACRDL